MPRFSPGPSPVQFPTGAQTANIKPKGGGWGGTWKGRLSNSLAGRVPATTLADAYGAPAKTPTSIIPAPTPQPVDYDSAYRSAMDASRSGIAKQFELALGDIARNERAAAGATQQLPQQLSDIYAQQQAAVSGATSRLEAAQAASGVPSYMPASAQIEPIAAAAANDLAARQASVPLLQLALQQEAARQRGGLQQARMDAENSLAAEDRQFALRKAGTADERAFQREMRGEDRLYESIARQDELAARAAAEQAKQDLAIDKNTGLPRKRVEEIKQDKEYKDVIASLRNKQTGGGGALWWKKPKKGKKPPSYQELYNRYVGTDLGAVLADDLPELAAIYAQKAAGG